MRKHLSLVLLLLATCLSSAWADPISSYYLTADNFDFEVQGAAVVNTWATQAPQMEYPIAISGGTIKTTSHMLGITGAEYDLAGNYTGNNYVATLDQCYDGTSDGTYNYTVQYLTGDVYRTDLDWQNPVLLFNIGDGSELGITYDGTNNSLWVSDFDTDTVRNFTMGGGLISSFSAGIVSLTCLALDPADGTLWMGSQLTEGTFYQYSKAGVLLDTVTYGPLAGVNTLGGEMVPEPGSLILVGLGAVGLAIYRRKK
ncbi:MAG TPA: PEP-CTERM sorting domain-containing protein [Candidatus Brocadiia bacterium]|nr:PEP-CTERM sorting domain-containing protein [Candidatus Brocadiia bacterium]